MTTHEDYMKLARHIAPDWTDEELSSHAPEQIIDWGLQRAQEMRSATEHLGRFGHHPDPAIDFCVEVESIEGEWFNLQMGFENGTPTKEDLLQRTHIAMNFRVGGDLNAITAKTMLRKIYAEMYDRDKKNEAPHG